VLKAFACSDQYSQTLGMLPDVLGVGFCIRGREIRDILVSERRSEFSEVGSI